MENIRSIRKFFHNLSNKIFFLNETKVDEKMLEIFIVGNTGVGKTSFLRQYVNQYFSLFIKKTKSIGFLAKEIEDKSMKIWVYFWDTSGLKELNLQTNFMYQRAQGLILMYDICNRDSFEQIEAWLELVNKNSSKKLSLLLCGNKCDKESVRQVSHEEGEQLAKKVGAFFFETSAKTGKNVEKALLSLFKDLLLN